MKNGKSYHRHNNTVAYTLARLRKTHPDLAWKVYANEISANAAAIQAGLRPRSVQFSERTKPEDAARKIREVLGEDYWQRMKNPSR